MDYSTASSDFEQAGGSSPWASNSPQMDRSGLSSAAPGTPPPSSPAQQQSPRASNDGSPSASRYHAVSTEISKDLAGPTSTEDDNDSPDLSEQLQSAQPGDADYIGEHEANPYNSRPAQQHNTQHPRPARYQRAQRPAPAYKLQAKITALERTGRKDPVLRFDAYTNLPRFRTTQFRDVRRTHSEFVKLAHHLISSNPEALVPAVPPSLTSAGAGTDEDEARVKASLQRWLNYVCGNEVLMRDEEMVFFVESDFGYSPVVNMKQPATGVRRKVIKQFAPPPDDCPELHNARPVVKLFYLGTLETHQKLEKWVKARRGLGLAESSLGEKLSLMHVQEIHPGLSTAYRKLGRVIQTCGDFHAAQGTAEATTLGDPLNYYSQDAFIVKETFTNRHILLREFLQAESTRRGKESAVTRLKSSTSVRRDKVDEAISSLDEAVSQENYLKGKTQRVTGNLLLEKRRWFDRTSKDLNMSIREYVIREIEAERRMLSTLESVRPDIRAIDATGGLSRLGREHNPAARRASLASSQGAKGDAWSGVPRTRDSLNRSISGSFTGAGGGSGGGLSASSTIKSTIPEEDDNEDNNNNNGNDNDKENNHTGTGNGHGDGSLRDRPRSSAGSANFGGGGAVGGGGGGLKADDEDRVDARNAASRLAQSTF